MNQSINRDKNDQSADIYRQERTAVRWREVQIINMIVNMTITEVS